MLKNLLRLKNLFFWFCLLIIILLFLSRGESYDEQELSYGVTFSGKQADNLGLDWRAAYLATLDDLQIKKLRLPVYWDEVESANNQYYWADLDWQLEQAGLRGVEVVLAVGGRVPRWPECHFPDWAKNISKTERQAEILEYERAVIERYRGLGSLWAWQIENEPFLNQFGECPKLDSSFLDEEIALAKSLDRRPIIITDSGELSFWVKAARRADIFGTSIYRDTYSRFLKRYIHYPIAPGFFQFKKRIVGWFAKPQDWIVIELQAEPWGPVSYIKLSESEKARTMNAAKFDAIIEFSRLAGFREFYLWGVEWWYWEKALNNNPVMWERARVLFGK